MIDRYDPEYPPAITLSERQTSDTFFLANLFAASCARIGKETPDNPYSAVIEFCKILVVTSAQNDPKWQAEIAERAAVWADRDKAQDKAKARMN